MTTEYRRQLNCRLGFVRNELARVQRQRLGSTVEGRSVLDRIEAALRDEQRFTEYQISRDRIYGFRQQHGLA